MYFAMREPAQAVVTLIVIISICSCNSSSKLDQKIDRRCGVIACITSPYLAAKGGSQLIGVPVAAAVATMGSAPTSSVDLGNGSMLMSWIKTQDDRDLGLLSCTENLTVKNGLVIDYSGKGHC